MEWPLLQGLTDDVRQAVLSTARRRTFAANEIVFHRNDPGDTMHLVVKGVFAARIVTPLGDVATLSILLPGDSFGELALLSGDHRRTATVVALEAGETRALPRTELFALRRAHPHADDLLLRALAEKVERLSRQVVEALFVPADRRVLRRLTELGELFGDGNGGGPAVIPLTQEHLAGLAGAARGTVNRVLREAAKRGEVELGRGRVTILDAESLQRRGGAG
jgi:CRP-like cAMP-binding protein